MVALFSLGGVKIEEKMMMDRYEKVLSWERGVSKIAKSADLKPLKIKKEQIGTHFKTS